MLVCGHPCPSLCGEPCGIQQCHACAPQSEKEKVVDWILSQPLSDLNPLSDDLCNITITLSCNHTFTVETLDGICELKQFYQQDSTTGQWIRPTLPIQNSVKIFCCPTCRTPINARRYGRVTKRSNLDLLERNEATYMARSLHSIHNVLANLNRQPVDITTIFALDPAFVLSPTQLEKLERTKHHHLSATKVNSALSESLLWSQMDQICGLLKSDCTRWIRATKPFQVIYAQAAELSVTRTASLNAYDASLSMLYERELERSRRDPRPAKRPEDYALMVAKIKVGMEPPRIDTRFQVESIWTTIDVRFQLGSLAGKVHSALSQMSHVNDQQLDAWGRFTLFIYHSCLRDASLATRIASSTNAHRQKLLSDMRAIKASWHIAQFEAMATQGHYDRITPEAREALTFDMQSRLDSAKKEAQHKRNEYTHHTGLDIRLVEEQFDLPLQECFVHWEDLITSLHQPSVFYQPVAEDEIRQVLSSFTEYSESSLPISVSI